MEPFSVFGLRLDVPGILGVLILVWGDVENGKWMWVFGFWEFGIGVFDLGWKTAD